MKGILFKPDMIKAIVEGRKTQTRRVIKPQPIESVFELKEHSQLKAYWIPYAKDRQMVNNNAGYRKDDCGYKPRYQVGETVYIKEALYRHPYLDEAGYMLDQTPVFINQTIGDCVKWRWQRDILTGMFMPQEAARYFIKITDVKAERLILPLSPDDLEREGGEQALAILEKVNGLWLWVYSFTREA